MKKIELIDCLDALHDDTEVLVNDDTEYEIYLVPGEKTINIITYSYKTRIQIG